MALMLTLKDNTTSFKQWQDERCKLGFHIYESRVVNYDRVVMCMNDKCDNFLKK